MDIFNNSKGGGKFIRLVSNLIGNETKSQEVVEEFHDKFRFLIKQRQRIVGGVRRIKNWDKIISNVETGDDSPSLVTKGRKIGLVEVYNRKWIALRLALSLYRTLLASKQKFEQERKQVIRQIFSFDPELANMIASIRMPEASNLEGLEQLKKEIIKNPNDAISYIKTSFNGILKQVNVVQDKKKSEELKRLVIEVRNQESEELLRCLNDVRSWSYRVTYGIDLFIQRPVLFLIGGKSRFDNESFLGLQTNFKDLDLAKQVYKSSEIRKLITYKEELKFFSEARYAIRKSIETQGKWEGFYAFYNNLDNGENYIKRVRGRFGNEEFARLLEIFKEKRHEDPSYWEHELGELTERLLKRAYPLVVEPARQVLIRIFDSRISDLTSKGLSALDQLKDKLTEADAYTKFRIQFLEIIAKRRNELKKNLKNEQEEFRSASMDILLAADEFGIKFEQLIADVNSPKEMIVQKQILDLSMAWRNFINRTLSPLNLSEEEIEKSVPNESLEQSKFGIFSALKVAEIELANKRKLEKKYEAGVIILNQLIDLISNSLNPGFNKSNTYIRSRLPDYAGQVKSLLEFDEESAKGAGYTQNKKTNNNGKNSQPSQVVEIKNAA